MGTKALRKRENWQNNSGSKAGKAESDFFQTFSSIFKDTNYVIEAKPREFSNIYSKIKLPQSTLRQIYNPDETWQHGVIPDFAIRNLLSEKTLYVEVKRQDGWVEGKERKAGRGNAHERSCKFFTPGLLHILRKHSGIKTGSLPFWVVFQGDIARDPKRVREIYCWYGNYHDHFFLWTDSMNTTTLINHFNNKLKGLLD